MGPFDREYRGPPTELLPPAEQFAVNDRAARRTLRLLAVALFVVVVGAAFAFTVTRERADAPALTPSGQSANEDGNGASAGDSIGPGAGADVGAYLEARKQALAAATGERVAVVSFDGYVSEGDARGKVGSLAVEALLAAAPGAHPSVVTTGLDQWAKTQRAADEVERTEIKKLLPTVNDPVFKQFYESEIVRLDTAIESVSPTSPVVFGVVVRGPTEALGALAATPEIRLVDVGDSAMAGPDASYRGLRPEESTKVGQPATRPV